MPLTEADSASQDLKSAYQSPNLLPRRSDFLALGGRCPEAKFAF